MKEQLSFLMLSAKGLILSVVANFSESMVKSRLSYTRSEQKIVESEKTRPEKGPSIVPIDNLHSLEMTNPYKHASQSDGNIRYARIGPRSVDMSTENLDFTQVAIKEPPTNASSLYSVSAI